MTGGPPRVADRADFADSRGRPRVAITGMGVQTPAGRDLKVFIDTVYAGRSCARPLNRPEPGVAGSRIACQITDFDAGRYASAKTLRRTDRFAQLALAAALDAYVDAGSPQLDRSRAGISSGTYAGGLATLQQAALAVARGGPSAASPLTTSMFMGSAAAALIAMELGWHGPNSTASTASASGSDAIGQGMRMIQCGEADTVLAGAADSGGLSEVVLSSFDAAGALSTRNADPATATRPFDADRDGHVIAEGAAFLLLERLDLAVERGARIYAEASGYARTCDAHHVSAPHPGGCWTAACMAAALADAGLAAGEVRQVNCHATGTRLGDAAEAAALRAAFPEGPPPVTASKGVLGHLQGAAGAAEAVIAIWSCRGGLVPPTAGHRRLAADCAGLDVVVGGPREVGPGPALSNSFGLGGQNASLVFVPYRGSES